MIFLAAFLLTTFRLLRFSRIDRMARGVDGGTSELRCRRDPVFFAVSRRGALSRKRTTASCFWKEPQVLLPQVQAGSASIRACLLHLRKQVGLDAGTFQGQSA
jgi:hypothetical protein